MIEKANLYLYFWNILLQFDPVIKSSSKEATEVPTRTHNICKKLHANLKKSNFVPWKRLSFQSGWWRRLRAAYAKFRNCRVGILKLISNILYGNCQSTDKNTCNVDITANIRKIKLYLYLWKILLQFDPTMKSSSKEVTEVPTRMYTTWTKRQISKRANWIPWMDDMRSAGEVLILVSTVIWAILNGSCWSTDKNMHNIDSHKCSKTENSYLYLRMILFQFDLKIKPPSKEATELPTRTYSTLTKQKYWKEKICTLKMIMFPKWNGEGTLQLLYAWHRNCRLGINFGR